MLRETDFYLLL